MGGGGLALADTRWVITGTLSRPREEITELILEKGGKVSGSLSNKTSYLLAGAEAGSKLEKAKTLGVKVVDEAEFRRMLGGKVANGIGRSGGRGWHALRGDVGTTARRTALRRRLGLFTSHGGTRQF